MDKHIFGTPDPTSGSGFTGVVCCCTHPDETTTCATRIPFGEPVVALASLPLGKITIYDATVADTGDILFLAMNDQTWWCHTATDSNVLSSSVLELVLDVEEWERESHSWVGKLKFLLITTL